ncbi:hypothetical protein CsSME_00046263 [Camellia sinensis var. sinensis]
MVLLGGYIVHSIVMSIFSALLWKMSFANHWAHSDRMSTLLQPSIGMHLKTPILSKEGSQKPKDLPPLLQSLKTVLCNLQQEA